MHWPAVERLTVKRWTRNLVMLLDGVLLLHHWLFLPVARHNMRDNFAQLSVVDEMVQYWRNFQVSLRTTELL